ncbi:MAG: bifunctional nuclease family protein [Sulfolobales archaeon]
MSEEEVEERDLIRIIDVETFITPPPYQVPVLQCELEDGRVFTLYQIPVEVMLGIMRLKGLDEIYNDRETLFEIMSLFKDEMKEVRERIDKVVIDQLDTTTNLYTARVVIKGDGYKIVKRMVPSHAIYIAYLLGVPAYVKASLVSGEEESEKSEDA